MGLALTSPPPLICPEPIICTLSEWDLPIVHTLALRRQAFKEAHNIPSHRIDPTLTDFGTHYIGAMGEFVVARELGIDIDRAIYLGGDNGVDLEKYYGCTLQVKTITYNGPNPYIVFNELAEFRAKACVAVKIKNPVTPIILGCISQQKFRDLCKPCNLKHGERVGVLVPQLSHLSVLMESVGARKNPA